MTKVSQNTAFVTQTQQKIPIFFFQNFFNFLAPGLVTSISSDPSQFKSLNGLGKLNKLSLVVSSQLVTWIDLGN